MECFILPAAALAQIDPSPRAVTVPGGGSGSPVSLALTFDPPTAGSGAGTVVFTGLPAGIATLPSPVTFPFFAGNPASSTSFRFQASLAAHEGTYSVGMTASGVTCGGGPCTGSLTLRVVQPSFAVRLAPNPLQLEWGAPPSGVTVTTMPEAGFSSGINYSFQGFPPGINWGSPQVAISPYPPLTFQFSVSPGTSPGSYSGTLIGAVAGRQPVAAPMTVVVVQPGIRANFASPSVELCDGGPGVSNEIVLEALRGYSGTPQLSFDTVPPGVVMTPASPVSPPLPPTQRIPFTVASRGAPAGVHVISLRVRDPAAGVDTTAQLSLRILAQGFQAAVSPPNPTIDAGGAPAVITAAIAPGACFTASTVDVTPSGAPPGLAVTPASAVLSAPAYTPVDFTVRAGATLPAGSYPVTFAFTTPGGLSRMAQATITVRTTPDFNLTVTPPAVTIRAGTSTKLAFRVEPLGGFTGSVDVTVRTAGDLRVEPPTFSVAAGAEREVLLSAGLEARPGTWSLAVEASAPGVPGSHRLNVPVVVTEPPGFSITVSPPAVTVEAGRSAPVVFRVDPLGGFAGPVEVEVQAGPGVWMEPASFSVSAGSARQVKLRAGGEAPPGAVVLSYEASAPGVPGSHRGTIPVTVLPPPPVVTSVTPPALSPGTESSIVRLTGENFRPGATASSPSPDLIFTRTTVLSPALAEAVVTVSSGAAPGPRRVDVTNPDGSTSHDGGVLLVARAGSIGAPLGVTVAAIVFPREDTLIQPAARVLPRGVLATTGLGTIVGSWRLDGIPFERFTVSASAGMPVKVEATTPIPALALGRHSLQLAVEQPRSLVSAPVAIVVAAESLTGIEIFAPKDGVVFGSEAPLFRWSLVPGASGYEVEIPLESAKPSFSRRLPESEWRPSRRDIEELGPGEHRLRVRPVFPGDVPGEPSPWLRFIIPGEDAGKLGSGSDESPAHGESWGPPGRGAFVRCSLYGDAAADGQAASPGSAGENPAGPGNGAHRDGQGVGIATITVQDQDGESQGSAARLQLSTRLDVAGRTTQLKTTSDLSGRHDLGVPHQTVLESHNWDLLLGAGTAKRILVEARVGYSPPRFLDQVQFLSPGLARGGIEAGISTRLGSLYYYRTENSIPSATAGMALTGPQRIEAVGYTFPGTPGRTLFRVFSLRSDDEGGPWTAAAKSQAFGLLWGYSPTPALALSFEGAWGRYEPRETAEKTEGGAFRLSASGSKGIFSYSLGFRKTDSTFVNPANPGLTTGGVPDRRGLDLMLSVALGKASLSFQAHRLESGGAGATGPKVAENGGTVGLNVAFSPKVMLVASGTLTTNRGGADPSMGLPGTDRSLRGLSLNLTELVGRTTLTQALTWQDMADGVLPGMDQSVAAANLSVTTSAGAVFAIMGSLSGTRTRAAPQMGTTDQYLATLQPTMTWIAANLSLTLRGSYGRVKNDVARSLSTSEQYQVTVQWSPSWLGSLLAVQAAAGWSRARSSYQTGGGVPFQRSLALSLVIRHSATFAHPAGTVATGCRPPGRPWRTAALMDKRHLHPPRPHD